MNNNVQRWLDERFVPADDKYVQDLDTMALHYVIALLWVETTNAPDDSGSEPLDGLFAPEDLSEEFWLRVRQDVLAFARAEMKEYWRVDPAQAGHDLWLTRQHHGCGFWEKEWEEIAGVEGANDYLDKVVEGALKETYVYVGDDGRLYFGD